MKKIAFFLICLLIVACDKKAPDTSTATVTGVVAATTATSTTTTASTTQASKTTSTADILDEYMSGKSGSYKVAGAGDNNKIERVIQISNSHMRVTDGTDKASQVFYDGPLETYSDANMKCIGGKKEEHDKTMSFYLCKGISSFRGDNHKKGDNAFYGYPDQLFFKYEVIDNVHKDTQVSYQNVFV